MLHLIYLYRNLTRNHLRIGLTLAAVALPITIYVLSSAVVDGVERFLNNSTRQLRLAVTHKLSIINPLPFGYRAKIQSLDPTGKRLMSVCGLRWLGGRIEGDPRPLATVGADADTFVETFAEQQLTEEEVSAWKRDRQAIIVGEATAVQFGWKVGDRVTIQPSVPPFVPMEFHIISTAPNALDKLTNWVRRDYVEETIRAKKQPEGQVTFFFIKCATTDDLSYFRSKIDDLFARSPDETKTQDEKAFLNEFITQQLDLPRNLSILGAVTVFVAILAAANTMSMSFRDRINEIAILKSMGFSGRVVFWQVQAESLLLCAIGGVIGAMGPFIAFTYTPLKDVRFPLILHLNVHPDVCVKAMVISLVVGVLAGAWPSFLAWRMRVVAALRNVE